MRHSGFAAVSLYSARGQRKYLTPPERRAFIATADSCTRRDVRVLCLTIAYTGCRISEALQLRSACIDFTSGFIAIRTLKKRGVFVVREVPVPPDLLGALASLAQGLGPDEKLWPLCRSRAWQLIKDVMRDARIGHGIHATPKGLRHGFAIHTIRSGVPLNLVQRWLGHSKMETTAVYLQALGAEEREIAAKMWTAQNEHHGAHSARRLSAGTRALRNPFVQSTLIPAKVDSLTDKRKLASSEVEAMQARLPDVRASLACEGLDLNDEDEALLQQMDLERLGPDERIERIRVYCLSKRAGNKPS